MSVMTIMQFIAACTLHFSLDHEIFSGVVQVHMVRLACGLS